MRLYALKTQLYDCHKNVLGVLYCGHKFIVQFII